MCPPRVSHVLTHVLMKHDRLLQEASKQAEEFKPQEIANTLWALATAGVQIPASLVECLSRRAESTAKEFNPQDIANTLWALATAGVQIPASLVECLSRRAESTAKEERSPRCCFGLPKRLPVAPVLLCPARRWPL